MKSQRNGNVNFVTKVTNTTQNLKFIKKHANLRQFKKKIEQSNTSKTEDTKWLLIMIVIMNCMNAIGEIINSKQYKKWLAKYVESK